MITDYERFVQEQWNAVYGAYVASVIRTFQNEGRSLDVEDMRFIAGRARHYANLHEEAHGRPPR